MTLLSAVPALPTRDVRRAVEYFVARLGFTAGYVDADYGVVTRDRVELHLWPANSPEVAGAEPHLAGSASCRIAVADVTRLYEELRASGVVHPKGSLDDGPWGPEFTALDADCNAVTFFQPERPGPGSTLGGSRKA
ncbi:VOC family protein [Blastococcus montanus]|uniref:VOC family protein n=1 Tax=Blastococcus montanus TaxID=3144973 RepID=UPI003209FC45